MAALIQIRRDLSTVWTLVNPILADGELGLEIDTQQIKVGNGVDPWNTLSYYLTGPAGPSGSSYTHNQAVPAATWTVTHNLGYNPNVAIVDSSDRLVVGEVQYIDLNTLEVSFTAAFGGSAYLS